MAELEDNKNHKLIQNMDITGKLDGQHLSKDKVY